MLAAALFGVAAKKLGQPAVLGHLIAGIALGPSFLGRLPGHLMAHLFPRPTLQVLNSIGQLAVVLFLFSVGYELDLFLLRQRRRTVAVVSFVGVALPLSLGVALAFVMHQWFGPVIGKTPMTASFVGFIAVAVSITAMPVLAAIIRERALSGTMVGVVATASAGVVDAVGWTVLSLVLIGSSSSPDRPWTRTLLLLAVFLAAMLGVVRPALRRWVRGRARASAPHLQGIAMVLAAGSAWVTSALGLHVIFGAFVAGLVMPRQRAELDGADLLRPVREAGELLIPVFFTVAGFSVSIGALGTQEILLLVLICLVAVVGKMGGCSVGARLTGMSWRDSSVVGALMSTRGLTELVVLNVGLQAGLLSSRLYTIFVLMALVTTLLASPLVELLRRRDEGPLAPVVDPTEHGIPLAGTVADA
jgi:Kef-type K+ transport system membrane component KefB